MLQDRTDPNVIYLGTNVGVFPFAGPRRDVDTLYATKAKAGRKASGRKTGCGTKVDTGKQQPSKTTTAAGAKERRPMPGGSRHRAGRQLALSSNYRQSKGPYIYRGRQRTAFSPELTQDFIELMTSAKAGKRLPLGEGISDNIFVIHISPKRPHTIWVGTAGSGVIVSNDDGQTWRAINGVPQEAPISSITTDPQRARPRLCRFDTGILAKPRRRQNVAAARRKFAAWQFHQHT